MRESGTQLPQITHRDLVAFADEKVNLK